MLLEFAAIDTLEIVNTFAHVCVQVWELAVDERVVNTWTRL